MAVVKGPAMSIDASGNVGGLCYSRWRGMSIARAAWSGTVPNTTGQVTSQGYLTTTVGHWGGTLSAAQRDSWNQAARELTWFNRLGQPYTPSGYHYFVKLTLKLLQNGNTWQVLPPERTEPVKYDASRATMSSAGAYVVIRFSWGSLMPDGCDRWEIFRAGPFDSGGYTAQDHDFRKLITNLTIYRTYDYAILDTKWYWYRWRWFNLTGVYGNWHTAQVQVDFP